MSEEVRFGMGKGVALARPEQNSERDNTLWRRGGFENMPPNSWTLLSSKMKFSSPLMCEPELTIGF